MKKTLLALLCLNTSLLTSEIGKIEEVGKSPTEAVFAAGGKLRLSLCSGAAEIQGTDENKIRVSYSSPHDSTAHVRVKVLTSQSQAEISVADCPHNSFQIKIEVPKSSHLYVRMFAGDLEVRDLVGDKDVEMHAGQLTMHIGQPTDYAHVDGSVSSGGLEAPPFASLKAVCFAHFGNWGRESIVCTLT